MRLKEILECALFSVCFLPHSLFTIVLRKDESIEYLSIQTGQLNLQAKLIAQLLNHILPLMKFGRFAEWRPGWRDERAAFRVMNFARANVLSSCYLLTDQ